MEKASIMKHKRLIYDLVLILCLLLISLVLIFVMRGTRDNGASVRISLAGNFVAEYPLDINAEYTLNGGTNILLVRDGCASVIYADCPDKICQKSHPISLVGERIVCLPNKLMIEIVGEGDVDFVS